jgi:putative FmdB family regulatory protein
MPIYDFRCPKCGRVFEVSRPRDRAGDPAECPDDGTLGVRNYASVGILRGTQESGGDGDGLDGLGGMDDLGHGHSHGPGSHMH